MLSYTSPELLLKLQPFRPRTLPLAAMKENSVRFPWVRREPVNVRPDAFVQIQGKKTDA